MIMKLIAKFLKNERILKLINSNRFRGVVIGVVTWVVTMIKPGFFEESIIAEIASYLIYALAGITYTVGKNEAENRRYSEKKQRWQEEA